MRTLVNRRTAIWATTAACSYLVARDAIAGSIPAVPARDPFRMHFAPHPGSFKHSAGPDVLDQIRFAHDQGFTAWEHNSMPNEPVEMQTRIGDLLERLKMKMGVFVAFADFERPTFAVKRKEYRDEVLKKIKASIEIAKRCRAKFVTVVPGTVDQQSKDQKSWNRYGGPRLAPGYQLANVLELLRECAEILEPHGITMVLEPLNWKSNHGGVFLQRSDQAYAICKAVKSKSCKILFDIYHQQITEGNLIANIDQSWSEIAYFQSGDNPGRKEPGTGEINYRNVFRHIAIKSAKDKREFIIGMEHGNSIGGKDGEKALVDAYRKVDPK